MKRSWLVAVAVSALGLLAGVAIAGRPTKVDDTVRGAALFHPRRTSSVMSLAGTSVNVSVTTPDYSAIESLAGAYGPITAQLMACSRLHGKPTCLNYRIVVTGRLESVA